MASERIQRRIERLLDQIDQAEAQGEWHAMHGLAQDVLEVDPGNEEAAAYLRSAERHLAATSEGAGISPASPPPVEPTGTAPDAERRQLTVMFCDLQGSTALSQQLDPEDLRDVIRGYQEVCAGAVGRYDGHISKYLGDGLLVYFGYPQAHEDDPQRAVRAGLAILEDMGGLNALLKADKDLELTVRIGIHTGLVVAGEMGGGNTLEELAIVGETPNIAARIEGAALPNSVVVSDITANLIHGFFRYETLGPHELKGIAQPVELFRVIEESGAQTRFEVATATRLTSLVGRLQEVGLLLDRWEQVEEGLGQIVLVSGEAGIGKSRLIDALGERLEGKTHTRWRLRCSAYHQTSTLHPLKEFLEVRLGLERDDSPKEKLAKLEHVLAANKVDLNDGVPLLASLLSLPLDDLYPPIQESPEGQKEITKEILVQLLIETDDQQPVLLVVEDLHWADPTTLEFLSFLVDQAPTTKLLALLTFRPEFTQPWGSRAHLSQISLNRLPRRLTNDMLTALTGGKEFPAEIVLQISAKSDGVPLFVEELTRMVIESGLVVEEYDRYVLNGPLPELAIPSTLQDSFTARLDRLSSVKESIQLAAVLGREFGHDLIRLISPLDDATLVQHLEQLVTGDFLYQRGTPPDAVYTFKHALIQDAAYNSLLISRRQQYHKQTAIALSENFAETADAEPELLAYHYFEAGLTQEAVAYWLQAGEQSLSRYAWQEALAHFLRGLSAKNVEPTASEPAQDSESADLLFGLGRAQAATFERHQLGEAFNTLSRAFEHYVDQGNVTQAVAAAIFPIAPAGVQIPGLAQLMARALTLVPGDSHEAGRLLSRYGGILGAAEGDYEGAQQALDSALTIARREGDRPLELQTLTNAADVSGRNLNWQESIDNGVRAIELLTGAENPYFEVLSRYFTALSFIHLGDPEGSLPHALALRDLTERRTTGVLASLCYGPIIHISCLQGDWDAARQYSDQSLEVAPSDPNLLLPRILLEYETGESAQGERFLDELLEAMRRSAQGRIRASGRVSLAISTISRITGVSEGLEMAREAANMLLSNPSVLPQDAMNAIAGLALLAVQEGDRPAAKEHYEFLLGKRGTLTSSAKSVDRILGLLSQTMGDVNQSSEHFKDALEFCRKAGYRPELAWSCCDYADMLTERGIDGDRAESESLLDESLTIATELGMRPLIERVRSRLDKLPE